MTFNTPGRSQQQAETYRQLGQLIQAGVPVMQALRVLVEHPPAPWVSRLANQCLFWLEQGTSLTEALGRVQPPLSAFDLALIEAGEQGGRLAEMFALLGRYHEMQAQIARRTFHDLLYPIFLLHFAVFIFPFSEFFTSGGLGRYLMKTVGLLVPMYAVLGGIWYAFLPTHPEAWRAGMERLVRRVPVLGKARYHLVLARLAAALHALLNAGVPVFRAWELAAAASGSAQMRKVVGQWPPELAAGRTPAELVRESPEFPTLFANLYSGGEISGRLDEELRHLQAIYFEEGEQGMKVFWTWMPKLIYLLIALAIAYKVISFYMGYYSGIFREM